MSGQEARSAARDQVSLEVAARSRGMTARELERLLKLLGIDYDRRLRLVPARLVNLDNLQRRPSRV